MEQSTPPVCCLYVLLAKWKQTKVYALVTNIVYADNKVSGISQYGVIVDQDYSWSSTAFQIST